MADVSPFGLADLGAQHRRQQLVAGGVGILIHREETNGQKHGEGVAARGQVGVDLVEQLLDQVRIERSAVGQGPRHAGGRHVKYAAQEGVADVQALRVLRVAGRHHARGEAAERPVRCNIGCGNWIQSDRPWNTIRRSGRHHCAKNCVHIGGGKRARCILIAQGTECLHVPDGVDVDHPGNAAAVRYAGGVAVDAHILE